MNGFQLTVRTGNSAFHGERRGPELARILHKLADRLAQSDAIPDGDAGDVVDANGNRCGWWACDGAGESDE